MDRDERERHEGRHAWLHLCRGCSKYDVCHLYKRLKAIETEGQEDIFGDTDSLSNFRAIVLTCHFVLWTKPIATIPTKEAADGHDDKA